MSIWNWFRQPPGGQKEPPSPPEPPSLPFRAKVIEWEPSDQVGLLRSSEGFELRFGGSACSEFVPEVGLDCWVVETKPDPLGRVRARLVNLTGQPGLTPEAAAAARVAAEKAAEKQAVEAERQRLLQARQQPAAEHYEQIRRWTGFELPPLLVRAISDGATSYGDDPNGTDYRTLRAQPLPPLLLFFEEWLAPYAMVEELRPRAENPLDWEDLKEQPAVSMDEVMRTWKHDIPFARDGSRGWWVFRKDLGEGDQTPVFYCEKTGERDGYAPHFEGFIFRRLLEALAEHEGESESECHDFLARSIARARPYLRDAWAAQLEHFLTRTPEQMPSRGGRVLFSYVSREEVAKTVRTEFAFAHLDEELD